VKNVTGYDLCKLLAGSWGTLAVMTEVTLKVMPRPKANCTLALRGLETSPRTGNDGGSGLPFDVSGAAHVPNSAFRAAGRARWAILDRRSRRSLCCGWKALRRRGPSRAALGRVLAPFGRGDSRRRGLGGGLEFVRDVEPFAAAARWGRGQCGGSFAPGLGRRSVRRWRDISGGDVLYDWGALTGSGGTPPKADAQDGPSGSVAAVNAVGRPRDIADALRSCRRTSDVFHPQQSGLAGLSERVRHSFVFENHPQSRPADARSCGMKTRINIAQLADPDIAEADKILRACRACGVLHAT